MSAKATPVLLGDGGIVDPTLAAVDGVLVERARQEHLRREGRFAHTLASPALNDSERFVLLAREFGEVARATALPITDRREVLAECAKGLRTELVQLAAVAVAWIEALDRGRQPNPEESGK